MSGVTDKQVVIDTLIPPDVDRFPWAGHLGLAMLEHVVEAIEGSRSTLVFTNVRSQAEIWYQGLLEARPEWAGIIGLHHGSLDADVRRWVEAGLKEGRLKAVVATSSLDLGVDFSPVERVLQIGSPKGVARLLQRAGRSGHAPGQASRVTCVPSHALEFVEAAAARRAAQAGRIEARTPVDRPLDLLTQHLVTIAAGEGFEEDGDEGRGAIDARLPRPLRCRMAMGARLRHARRRGAQGVSGVPARWCAARTASIRVPDAAIARRHRMSIGTIVSDAAVNIQYMRGKRLGNVEESFVARLAKGDNFIFAGQLLEFVRVENMTAYVTAGEARRRGDPALGRRPVPAVERGRPKASASCSSCTSRGARTSPRCAPWRACSSCSMRGRACRSGTRCWSSRRRRARATTSSSTRSRAARCTWGSRRCSRTASRSTRPATFSLSFTDYGFELVSRERFELLPLLKAGLLSHRQPARGHAREPQCRRALEAPVPRDRARGGPGVPGLPGPAQDQPPGAGHQRPHLGSVRALGPVEPAAGPGRARGARAPARVLAPGRGAATHGRDAGAAAPDPQAVAVRVPDHGGTLPREAHEREARRPRAAHAARVRQGFGRTTRGGARTRLSRSTS